MLPEVARSAAEAVAAVVPLRRDGHTLATPGDKKTPAEEIVFDEGAS
ncbi:hypothetical protein [Actinomadura flavalba]|nr:hypothetical protein [Actinomadura flavalba]